MKKLFLFFIPALLLFTQFACGKKSSSKFQYKLLPVKVDQKWGYIDRKGKIEINPQFQSAFLFSEGIALVQAPDGKYGYIDTKGNYVIEPKLKSATPFSEGIAMVAAEDEYPKAINKKGETVFELKGAYYLFSLKEGRAKFFQDEKQGFVDVKGNVVINPTFEIASEFSEGLCRVTSYADKDSLKLLSGFIDKSGELKINYQFESAGDFSEGLAYVESGEKYGYINKSGAFVINPQFDMALSFKEGLALVRQGDVYGYIDKSGKIVINPQFDIAENFQDGLAAVKSGTKWGYIDKKGKYVVNPQFDMVGPFNDGIATVKQGERFGLVDKKGKYVVNPQFDGIYDIVGYSDYYYYWDAYSSAVAVSDYLDLSTLITILFKDCDATKFHNLNTASTMDQLKGLFVDSLPLATSKNGYFMVDSKYRPVKNTGSIRNISLIFDDVPYTYKYDYYSYSYDYSPSKEFNLKAKVVGLKYEFSVDSYGSAAKKGKKIAEAIKNRIMEIYKVTEITEADQKLNRSELKYKYILAGFDKYDTKNLYVLQNNTFRFYIQFSEGYVHFLCEIIRPASEAPEEPYIYSSIYDDYDDYGSDALIDGYKNYR